MVSSAPSFQKRRLFASINRLSFIMDYGTQKKKDMEAEKELSKFLDKYLYTKDIFSKAERTNDQDAQINGSDIIVSIPSLGIENGIVDEKASIYYINKDLKTFVLEISFKNINGDFSDGWFINESLSTQYYLIQWIKANVEDSYAVKSEDITEIECVLVSKSKIVEYLKNEGLGRENLLRIANYLRRKNQANYTFGNKPYRIHYSSGLNERPVNLLLNISEYIRLGEFHYILKPTRL